MQNLNELYQLIIKTGLQTYKLRNSKAPLPQAVKVRKQEKLHKQGGIFIVRTKAGFGERVRGQVVRTYEHLSEITDKATHWTPNVYNRYFYTDDEHKFIAGFEERYLLQVNAFVVDIDTKKHSYNDIILACKDNSIGIPTLILETDSGYQVYFVLSKPIYMSNNGKGISLTVAKRISRNLKASLKSVDADIFCNDFGFFRMPNSTNIVWQYTHQLYTPEQCINWSMSFDDGKPLYAVPNKPKQAKYTQSKWFETLINMRNIKGHKGKIGRNNLLFTLALACFADDLPFEEAYDVLDQVNSNFIQPINDKEVRKALNSAYSGKYHAPAREHVEALLIENGYPNIKVDIRHGWYKFKKAREDRKRSHYDEWEQDLEKFLQSNKDACTMSQSQLCEALGIPRSTLNVLLKKSRKVFKRVEGVGRKATTTWLTLAMVLKEIMDKVGAQRISYQTLLTKLNGTLNRQLNTKRNTKFNTTPNDPPFAAIEELVRSLLFEAEQKLSTLP